MKKIKYIGFFHSKEGDTYQLDVYCNGFLQAFFLLTADAIKSGRYYQLQTIKSEKGEIRMVDDITKCCALLS